MNSDAVRLYPGEVPEEILAKYPLEEYFIYLMNDEWRDAGPLVVMEAAADVLFVNNRYYAVIRRQDYS